MFSLLLYYYVIIIIITIVQSLEYRFNDDYLLFILTSSIQNVHSLSSNWLFLLDLKRVIVVSTFSGTAHVT